MEIQPANVEYGYSWMRNDERVEVSRLYEDGFLYLKGDPELWIQNNRGGCLSSVRSLELYLSAYKKDRIGDSIGKLSQLTHLCIKGGYHLKCLPNTISRLQDLHYLELSSCWELQELPANLGDCQNLASLTLNCCSLKSLPNSVAKLSKLTTLNLTGSDKLEELPSNLGDLKLLTTLFLDECNNIRSLPWSITKLSMLRSLYLPQEFIFETLPPYMSDSIVISVDYTHIRKTWKELKTEIHFPIIPEEAPQETSTPGYFRFNRDPTKWIGKNYNLLSSVRILDLDLGDCYISDSVGELPQLTHLCITRGCLHRLSLAFNRITHLSLIKCTFECDTKSHFKSLGKLSNLISLHLYGDRFTILPEHMDFPISLRHLTTSFPDNYMTSVTKLSNLETLNLYYFKEVESLPLDMNLNKLILRKSCINSVPIGLRHLEIIHGDTRIFWNQLVNLETLSYTCYKIESFSSMTSLPNLRELQLKDCFKLNELPPNLDEMVKLCTLNVSGTRIKSLPNSITKLHNLRLIILPNCFNLENLPRDFEKKVKISVDDTDESYYKDQGYYNSDFETSDEEDSIISDTETLEEEDPIISDSTGGVNEIVLEESGQEAIIESGSSRRPLNHYLPNDSQILEGSQFTGRKEDPISNSNHETEFLPTENEDGIEPFCQQNECLLHFKENTWQGHAPMEIEGSHLNGENNAVSENNSHANFNLQNQEFQIGASHSRNRDGVVTYANDITAEPSSNVHEIISCGANSQEAHRNGRMDNVDNVNSESEHGVAACDSLNPVHGGSNHHALKIRQDNNSKSGNVKQNTQKKEIPLERITELMSQEIRLTDAAEHLDVSRSTLKRALKKHELTWPSTRKRKNPDKNWNETHDVNSSFGRNLSQLKSVDPSNPTGLGQGARYFDRPNQHTMSAPEPNVVNGSNPNPVIRAVEEPPVSTQCRMDGHQHVEEHVTGAKESALANADVHPNESCSTFVVKAIYNKDTVRFNFSLSSGFELLKEEVGKRFELEVGNFKMYYKDDEEESILMACVSDLHDALQLSKSSGKNGFRLSIKLKK